MSDVSAEDVQNLRQLRYEEMQKMKSQLKEQDQKWQDVSMPCTGWERGRQGKRVCVWLFFASLQRKSVYSRGDFPYY